MIKKAKKLWSKKLKAAIISLSLGLAIALGGAVAAISISANKNNNLGGEFADIAVSGSGTAASPYVITTPAEWTTGIKRAKSAEN